jgi:probable addiction module antidote protein
MSQAARDAGLSLESLYDGLSENSNPSLAIALKVVKLLRVPLHAEAV